MFLQRQGEDWPKSHLGAVTPKNELQSADGSFETLILCVDPEVLVLGTVIETLPP